VTGLVSGNVVGFIKGVTLHRTGLILCNEQLDIFVICALQILFNQASLAILPRVGIMSPGGVYIHCQGRNGEFYIAVSGLMAH